MVLVAGWGAAALSAQEPLSEFLDTIEVRVVNVDVVVLDRDGRPLPGLTREDFELLENGKPVPITHFAGPEPGVAEPAADAGAAADEPAAPAASRLTLAILVDNASLRPTQRGQVVDRVRSFLARGFRPGDRALVAAIDGSLRQLAGLTTDRAQIEAALAELERRGGQSNFTSSRHAELLREVYLLTDDVAGQEMARGLYTEIETFSETAGAETAERLRAVGQLVESLASLDGHKVLLLATSGFSNRPAQDLFDAWQRRTGMPLRGRGSPLEYEPTVDRELRSLATHANSSRVTVFTVAAGDSAGMRADQQGNPTVSAGTRGDLLARQSALTYLADSTGGRPLAASPELDDALARMASELAGSYSLGYEPAAGGALARDLEVRVRRPGALVRHRRSWRERSPAERVSDATLAALLYDVVDNPLAVEAAVGAGQGDGRKGERTVPLRLRIPLGQLALAPAGADHVGKVAFYFARRDAEGRVAVFERRELALKIPNAELAQALRQSATYDVAFRFPRGAHRLAVAVHDELGNASSTLTLEVPASDG